MLGDQKNSPLYIELFDNELCCLADDDRSFGNEKTGNNNSSLLSTSQRSCATVGGLNEATVDANQFKSIPFNNYVTSPTHAVSHEQLTRPTHLSIPRQSHQGTNPLTSPSQFTPGMVTLHLSDFLKPQVYSGGSQSSSLLSASAFDEN